MDELTKTILVGIEKIVGRPVQLSENLLDEAIDSISLVELINMVDELAKVRKIDINLDALISEDVLTPQLIIHKLSHAT